MSLEHQVCHALFSPFLSPPIVITVHTHKKKPREVDAPKRRVRKLSWRCSSRGPALEGLLAAGVDNECGPVMESVVCRTPPVERLPWCDISYCNVPWVTYWNFQENPRKTEGEIKCS